MFSSPSVTRFARRLLALLLATSSLHAATTATQRIDLRAGWNAIYLELSPTNAAPEVVFKGLPLDSVWTVQEQLTSVDFIQDPHEPLWNRDRWAWHVPADRVEARGNRIFTLLANHPYLVKLTNAATLTITGVPVERAVKWKPGSYNLRGFALDPANPPSFLSFFRPSTAHYTTTTSKLQPIYQLSPSGEWQLVSPAATMKSGEAYWVYCDSASDYAGPLSLDLAGLDHLEFGEVLDRVNFRIRNLLSQPVTVTLTDLSGGSTRPLARRVFDPTKGITWPALGSPETLTLSAGTNQTVDLAIRRGAMSGARYETILSLVSSAGARHLLHLTASRSPASASAPPPPGPGLAAATDPGAEAKSHAGLWVGTIRVDAISEVHSTPLQTNSVLSGSFTDSEGRVTTNAAAEVVRLGFGSTPKPVSSPADLRLLVHVDSQGNARLLKQVVQMWQEGTTTTDQDGNQVPVTAGHNVLLTDEAQFSKFKGVVYRDGKEVGRRYSSAGFDFPGQWLDMSGLFAIDQTLRVTNTVASDLPTNPFRHKYHPDHTVQNSITVKRGIALQFLPATTNSPPGYGYSRLEGFYTEVIGGLHRTNLIASGTFSLTRVADTGALNQ